MAQAPQGWHPDPLGRFELRWWDGETWTDHVAQGGATQMDPLEAALAEVQRASASGSGAAATDTAAAGSATAAVDAGASVESTTRTQDDATDASAVADGSVASDDSAGSTGPISTATTAGSAAADPSGGAASATSSSADARSAPAASTTDAAVTASAGSSSEVDAQDADQPSAEPEEALFGRSESTPSSDDAEVAADIATSTEADTGASGDASAEASATTPAVVVEAETASEQATTVAPGTAADQSAADQTHAASPVASAATGARVPDVDDGLIRVELADGDVVQTWAGRLLLLDQATRSISGDDQRLDVHGPGRALLDGGPGLRIIEQQQGQADLHVRDQSVIASSGVSRALIQLDGVPMSRFSGDGWVVVTAGDQPIEGAASGRVTVATDALIACRCASGDGLAGMVQLEGVQLLILRRG